MILAGDEAAMSVHQKPGKHDRRTGFDSLNALYRALQREDPEAPEGFAEKVVPGEGRAGPPLMLVGEQPGDREDIAGRPFVGPAGRLLDVCLEDAGIDRGEVFITNAIKRFKFTSRGKRRLHQAPTAGDIAYYRWWLDQEIDLVDPGMLISLGGTALKALTGEAKLGAVRGRILDRDGRKVLPTIHPSYLFRFRGGMERERERTRFVHDLVSARKESERSG